MSLVRSGQRPEGDLDTLSARVAELEAMLGGRSAEIEQLRIDVAAFKVDYRAKVGLLHEQLDELEAALAEAELGVISERLQHEDAGPVEPATQPQSAPPYTSDAVRRLFRDVARAIHPDLADDDVTRDRRHALMVEANKAYRLGDEERLRWILRAWEHSPEAVQGSDAESTRSRLERRIAQFEEQLIACAAELATLKESPIWKLKVMVDEAAAGGRDLVAEMVRRLERDIMITRNRLDAIRWHPSA